MLASLVNPLAKSPRVGMWVPALVAFWHIGVGASFAFNSSAIQSPEPFAKPANARHAEFAPTKAVNHEIAPVNDTTNNADTNEEERGFWDFLLHVLNCDWHPARAFQAMEVVKTRNDLVENAEFVGWLDRLVKFVDDGGEFSYAAFVELVEKHRTPKELVPLYIWLRKFPHMEAFAEQRLMEVASVPEHNVQVLLSFFKHHASPEQLFGVLKIRDKISLTGSVNFDMLFKQWFEYITLYRTIVPYDDEKLFNFLVEEVESLFYEKASTLYSFENDKVPSKSNKVLANLRREVASTSNLGVKSLSTSKSAISASRRIVVKLFDYIHGFKDRMSLVTDMHRYFVLNPELKQIVFEQWVKYKPHQVFRILHLEDELDLDQFNIPLFNAWLDFVKVYCKSVNTEYPYIPYKLLEYRHLLITMSSEEAFVEKVESEKFIQMLDRGKKKYVTVDDSDNLVEILRVPNLIKQWLNSKRSPAEIIEDIKLVELNYVQPTAVNIDLRRAEMPALATKDKIMSTDVTFMAWLTFTAWYMEANPSFSIEQLHRLWSSAKYVEKLVTMLSWIRLFPETEDLANGLLKRMLIDPEVGVEALRAINFNNEKDWDYFFPKDR